MNNLRRFLAYSCFVILLLSLTAESCDYGTRPYPGGPYGGGGGGGTGGGNGTGGGQPNRAPISHIVLPLTAVAGDEVSVQNNSVDPDGDPIAEYRFRSSFQNFTRSSRLGSMVFPQAGTFTVAVSACDNRQACGAENEATITITPTAPVARVIFSDQGDTHPADVGYKVSFPTQGVPSLTWDTQTRTLIHHAGTGYAAYDRGFEPQEPLVVSPGTRIRLRVRLTTEFLNPSLGEVVADDYGYAFVNIVLISSSGQERNFFLLARNNLLSEGFAGSPRKLESFFKPGHDTFDRVSNGSWITRDLDLDELNRTRFDPLPNVAGLAISVGVRDVYGRSEEYRKQVDLDYLEVYLSAH